MGLHEDLIAQLKIDEGFSGTVYKCPAGYDSIGYGRNIQTRPLPSIFQSFLEDHGYITKEIAEALLYKDADAAINDCFLLYEDFAGLPEGIKLVLANMCYNLGAGRLAKFRKMNSAVDARDWLKMKEEMINSKWYRQVGQRAQRLVRIVSNTAGRSVKPS